LSVAQRADAAAPAPRHHRPFSALGGAGMPGDRMARLAARRAFLNLRQIYLTAIDAVCGANADWLRRQVLGAADPADLWLLRAALFDALPANLHRQQRDALQRAIETLFPRSSADSTFASEF
jgi:hypothetical protein